VTDLLPNIGQVLSYGPSFYQGDVPEPLTNPLHAPAKASEGKCNEWRDMLQDHSTVLAKRSQLVFTVGDDEEEVHATLTDEQVKEIQKQLYLACDDPSDSPYLYGSDVGSHMTGSIGADAQIMDARLAVLHFMSLATADDSLAAALSMSSREQIANSISSVFEHTLQPDGGSMTTEVLHDVPGTTAPAKARLGYVQTEDGKLNLIWHFEVAMDHAANSNFYQTTVDATTGEVRSVVDWVSSSPISHRHEEVEATGESSEALYKVIRWGLNDPTEGNRTLEQGVRDFTYSPYGWHMIPGKGKNTTYTDTRGNNVLASAFGAGMEDWQEPSRPRPKGKDENGTLVFDFPFPWRAADKQHAVLEPEKYADASTVNLFYTLNEYHDLLYLYGFTPAAGNFEEGESSEGGIGNDAIAAYAISSAGTNNADFTTPPDGQRPRVRMYKWHTKENATSRDGDFEAGVVIHEMTHGLTTRLTGGPADSSCLGWGEAGGYGEGAGDFLATIIRRKSPTRDIYPMGKWVAHSKGGIRKYPYSTNLTINPETYKTLDSPGYWGVHNIGEVFSNMLYQVEEGLRAKWGWHPDLFPTDDDKFYLSEEEVNKLTGGKARASKQRVPRHGNTLAVALFVNSMKLQPCRPGFFEIRDAYILADQHLTGGANECLIWSRFAQRGLGTDASVGTKTPWAYYNRQNGFKVPSKCKKEE
jgi:extracellular elastinolytic metalloproteinase